MASSAAAPDDCDAALHAALAAAPAPSGAGVSRPRRSVLELSSLPYTLLVSILAALPADARLRCAEVCRAWRAAVSDHSLWRRVDLSLDSGVTHVVTDALLRATSARAAGHMHTLLLPALGTGPHTDRDVPTVVMDVLRANSASLRELEFAAAQDLAPRLLLEEDELARVLDAAPQLRALRADVAASLADATCMLRNEAPYGALRVRFLCAVGDDDDDRPPGVDDAAWLALAGAMREHATLQGVELRYAPLSTPAPVLDALVDAALTRRLSSVSAEFCELSPAAVPALTRLLGDTVLTCLCILNDRSQLLDAPAASLLAAALRDHGAALRIVQLEGVQLWADAHAGAAVLAALTAHPSLCVLKLAQNEVAHPAAAAVAGAALGALLAADAPSLTDLHLSHVSLRDAGMAPLLHALRLNTHLRMLLCYDAHMSAAFERDTFLPAIRANTSLRTLAAGGWPWGSGALVQAEAFVEARRHEIRDAAAASNSGGEPTLCAAHPAAGSPALLDVPVAAPHEDRADSLPSSAQLLAVAVGLCAVGALRSLMWG
jgi:hypothetical protein